MAELVPLKSCGWKYLQIGRTDGTNYAAPAFDDSSWAEGCGSFGALAQENNSTFWALDTRLWLRRKLHLGGVTPGLRVVGSIDNDVVVYWNGTQIGSLNSPAGFSQWSFAVPEFLHVAGENTLAVRATDDGPQPVDNARVDASITTPAGEGFMLGRLVVG